MSHHFQFDDEDASSFHPRERGILIDGYCSSCGVEFSQFFKLIDSRVDEHDCPCSEHKFVIDEYEKKSNKEAVVHSHCEECDSTLLSYYERAL